MMLSGTTDILLVEDNPNDIELAVYAFTKNGIADRVRIVRDGVEALAYLFRTGPYSGRSSHDDPRIVLLDLKLPKVSGLEVLRSIKADDRTKGIPVIALTTSQENSDLEHAYRYGVNSYVVKPVEFDAFANAMQSIISYWLTLNIVPRRE